MRERLLKNARRARRKKRIRKRVSGTAERPRLSVARSHRNIAVQIIDDVSGRTLCALSTQSKELRGACAYGGNAKAAALVGKAVAEKTKSLGIERVCLDRNGRAYHGRIKALAEAAREAGLKF
jgi:large subunit ribosomal protein L18